MSRGAWPGPFSAAVGLGAFLLFLVQPMAGKAILPWFGGTAIVWTACLLFFQTALLAGYAWAHVGSRALGVRWVEPVHALLLLAACAVSIVPAERWRPSGGEAVAGGVLGLLAATVGAACVLLAASGPLLQASFHRAFPERSPYRLYAWSNLGSMLALVAYPFVIEPRMGLARQQEAWTVAFRIWVALCIACLVLGRRARRPAAPAIASAENAVPRGTFLRWAAWAAAGVILFMGLTNHVTMNVAAVPLLWVVPLAIYLASYIVAFAGRYPRRAFGVLLVPATLVVLASTLAAAEHDVARWIDPGFAPRTALLGASLFVLCTVCHGELYRIRPAPRALTGFYLAIAAGGVAGGALVALVAPRVLLPDQELHGGLLLLLALWLVGRYRDRASALFGGRPRWAWAVLLLAGAAVVVVPMIETRRLLENAVDVRRNEYGLLRLVHVDDGDDLPPHRRLIHGVTLHGAQFLEESRRRQPTVYYTPAGGGGAVLARFRAGEERRIGVIGLGTGTLAAYGGPRDAFRFYEIDPDVVDLARGSFTFLEDCPSAQEIVLGDARLSLEREPDREFDVLIVDAFSSDAVPVHLLTVEAFAVYARHLAEGGVMAFHVSNHSLDLTPLVYGLAERHRFQALHVLTREARPAHLVSRSDWMIVSRNTAFLEELVAELAPWKERGVIGLYVGDARRYRDVRPWTDDYSNLLAVLR